MGLEQQAEHHGRTQRLDWADPSLREWDCVVVWSDPADPEAGIVARYLSRDEALAIQFRAEVKDDGFPAPLQPLDVELV